MIGQLILSISLIICGLSVKRSPQFIAGYYLLSDEEKAKIDINGLSNFLYRILVGVGILSFFIYLIMDAFNIKEHVVLTINICEVVITIIIGSVYSNSAFKN